MWMAIPRENAMGMRTESAGPPAAARGVRKSRSNFHVLKQAQPVDSRELGLSKASMLRVAIPEVKCPCCSQPLLANPDLIIDLNLNMVVANGLALHLAPRTTEFLFVLREGYPRIVEHSAIGLKVWPGTLEPQRWIRQQATLGRIALNKLGWTVLSEKNIGYRLARFSPKIKNPAPVLPLSGATPCAPTSPAAAATTATSSVPITGGPSPTI